MLQETDIEKIINLVVGNVKLLKLLEGLDALDFSQFAASDVQHSHVIERRANVSEAFDDGVV